jgi:xanthine dehydrogenase accessory factor
MNKQLQIWKFIAGNLHEKIPVMLLYVLESKGSSPGRQGFFMAVNANGEMQGSIGGGIMEHKFVEMAKEKLQKELVTAQLKKQVHDKSASDRSGMICSGEQTILILPVQQGDDKTIHAILNSLDQNKNGALTLSPEGLRFSETVFQDDFHFDRRSATDWIYQETTGLKNHLYIVGGGHCALALSKLMSAMDFYIHLFEEREDLNTMVMNDFVHEKKLLAGYGNLPEYIASGHRHYVVIMSFGYRTDGIALRALLDKEFKYLGLLGSKKKIEKMFADLRNEGVSEDILQRIHSPAGLPINSQTPEEIAVSIAAEIISIKNGH